MNKVHHALTFIFLLAAVAARPVHAQTTSTPEISAPAAGDALQGSVSITGTNRVEGFLKSELAFTYEGDTTGTWFTIAESDTSVEGEQLAIWDTTAITDGNYTLRMRLFLQNGDIQEVDVHNLRVRNYTAIETPTPAPTAPQATHVPTATQTPTDFPTPLPLPTNQAILTSHDVRVNIGYGGLAAVVILLVAGVYGWLRRK